jgi:hypothetical protein
MLLLAFGAQAQDSLNIQKHLKSNDVFLKKTLSQKEISRLSYSNLDKLLLLYSGASYSSGDFAKNSYLLSPYVSTGTTTYSMQGIRQGEKSFAVDGMQIGDISMFPLAAIEKYQYYDMFSPAEYSNSLAGIAEIKTISHVQQTRGGIQLRGTAAAGKQFEINEKIIGFDFASPLTFMKKWYSGTDRLPFIIIAGNLDLAKDNHPSCIGSTYLNDEAWQALSEKPLVTTGLGSGAYKAAEFITSEDFQHSGLRKNSGINSFNPYLKISVPVSKKMTLSLGSYSNIYWGRLGFYQNALFNSEMNPEIQQKEFNNFLRFDHDVLQTSNLHLSYTLQLNYYYNDYLRQNANLKDDYFKYGYVGKFKTYSMSYFERGVDELTGVEAYLQRGTADTLVTFEASDINPVLSNYATSYYDIYANDPTGHYRNIDQLLLGNCMVNGYLGGPMSVYGLNRNVGVPDDNYTKSQSSCLNPRFNMNLAIKKNHNISVGFDYNRCTSSYYNLQPIALWQLLKQLVNKHIIQLDLSNPHLVVDEYNVFQDTILYDRLYNQAEQAWVDKNLREKLGLSVDGTDWIDVYNYRPETFSIDMFSPDELLNNGEGVVSYFGYDAYGNKVKTKSSLDFFTEKSGKGYYLRNIAPFTPISINAYANYQYASQRLNINLGFKLSSYNANQPMLKDPYLMYNAKTAGEVTEFGPHPANIGSDYVVYVDDFLNPSQILGYRTGDTWYDEEGNKLNEPSAIESANGINPYLRNPYQEKVNESAFTDYKAALNYLPALSFDYVLFKNTQLFGSFQQLTKDPFNNDFRPQQYYYIFTTRVCNNPDLKPEKISIVNAGIRKVFFNFLQAEASYIYKNSSGHPLFYKYSGAYPGAYYTWKNSDDPFVHHIINVSLLFKKAGKHEFNAAATYQRLLNENKIFSNVILSKNTLNAFAQYTLNKSNSNTGLNAGREILNVSLVGHFRSGTYYISGPYFLWAKVDLPAFYNIDLSVEKPFYLSNKNDTKLTVYAALQNIFNRKNVFYVYTVTGKAEDDGYLTSPSFQSQIAAQTNEQAFRDQYALMVNNPGYYDIPRMLLLGVKVDF